jgi:hypothetical protein
MEKNAGNKKVKKTVQLKKTIKEDIKWGLGKDSERGASEKVAQKLWSSEEDNVWDNV